MTNEEVKYHYFDVQKPSENNKRQYSPSLCLQQSTKHDHDKSVEQMKEIGCMYQESESHSALSRTEVHLLNNGQIAQGLITKEINNRLKQVQIKTPSDKKQNDDQKSGINSHSANPQIWSSQMQSRYFDGARSYQTDHVRPFELKNEPAPVYQDYELNPKFYMMNRNLNNQPSYGNNQLADPRSFDQLRMMSEMMWSMMAVQQNNFQIMISSHTQLMTKLIEKSGRHKRRHYCHSKSSKYES